jgi:hypothetical protein
MKFRKKKHKKDLIDEGLDAIDSGIKKVKKKVRLFYKINFFLALFLGFFLFYFLVLTQIKPIESKFLAKKINEYLQKEFDEKSSIDKTYISFTTHLSTIVTATDFKSEKYDNIDDNRDLKINKIKADFSFLNFLRLKFIPIKLVIEDSEFIFFNNKKDSTFTKEIFVEQVKSIAGALLKTQKKGNYVHNIEIENSIVSFLSGEKKNDILINNLALNIEDDKLEMLANLSFKEGESSVFVNNKCKISYDKSFDCNFFVRDLKSSYFTQNCEICENINAKIDLNLAFIFDDKFKNFSFSANSENGDFKIEKFFKDKINYKDFYLNAEYDFDVDKLTLAEVKADLTTDKKTKEVAIKQNLPVKNDVFVKFKMSQIIEGFFNENYKTNKINIFVSNLKGDDISKFWPLSLPKQEINEWVENHISGGIINDAFVRMIMVKSGSNSELTSLDSKVNFANLDVNYSEYFPSSTSLNGSVSFSKEGMQIDVLSGNFLESKIEHASVNIPDFSKPVLEIEAKSSGKAYDGLKYANFKSKKFVSEVEKYLNGEAIYDVSIKVPLSQEVNIKNIYLAVNSEVKNVKNKYFQGDFSISSKKNYKSSEFKSSVDLKNSKIDFSALALKKGDEKAGILSFVVDASSDKSLLIKNINFKQGKDRIIAKIGFSYDKKMLDYVDLKNNFGRNSYNFRLRNGNSFYLNGYAIDLSTAFNKIDEKGNFYIPNLRINSSLKRVYLTNNSILRNFSMSVLCGKKTCYKGSVNAFYQKTEKELINLSINKEKKENKYFVSGKVNDIGYVAQMLNLSNKISSGKARIKINQIDISKYNYSGVVEINNDITFYESDAIKKIEKDDLFSKIKDKIFSNGKTTFSNVKLEFSTSEKKLAVDSFVANNYKIGVTAKGNYDFVKKTYAFKGLIVPGFIINNLFGIGNIPILGSVVKGLLTGEEGGGLFGIKYEYILAEGQKEPELKTNAISSFVPVSIRNLFDIL